MAMRTVSGSRSSREPPRRAASSGERPAASSTAASASCALPRASAMRPQLGSRPWTAALNRLLDTTARAAARASASSRAPVTWHVSREVAPSPSAACWRASERQTASTAPRQRRPGVAARVTRAPRPTPPDATRNTVSLVLVSPSTDSWSQVRATIGRSIRDRSAGETAASVSTYASIVAMRGWIMPTPLAMPETVTGPRRPVRRRAAPRAHGRPLGPRVGRPERLRDGLEARRPCRPGRRRRGASRAGSMRSIG